MNKQQQAVLNMAGFIKSQSLTLLEKLDALDADEQATMCEKLHELAEELEVLRSKAQADMSQAAANELIDAYGSNYKVRVKYKYLGLAD